MSSGSRRGQVALLGELHRDVDDHVLLAADVAELAGPLQDLVRGDAVALGGPLGVQQETATPRPSPARSRTCPSSASGAGTAGPPPRPPGGRGHARPPPPRAPRADASTELST